MITCTFVGDEEVYRKDIETDIETAIESVFLIENEIVFLIGRLGEFERRCVTAIQKLRRIYCHLDIRLIGVLPNINGFLDKENRFNSGFYDEILVPPELDSSLQIPTAIKRDFYVVDKSDEIIACVYQNSGTAFELLQHAKIQGKRILNFPDTDKQVHYLR